jgi:hypothetical protein
MAGQASMRSRHRTDTAWLDSKPTRGNTHRSVSTPWRSAAETEHNTSAAA